MDIDLIDIEGSSDYDPQLTKPKNKTKSDQKKPKNKTQKTKQTKE